MDKNFFPLSSKYYVPLTEDQKYALAQHSHSIKATGKGDEYISVSTIGGQNSFSIDVNHNKKDVDSKRIYGNIESENLFNIPSIILDNAGHISNIENLNVNLDNKASKDDLQQLLVESKSYSDEIKDDLLGNVDGVYETLKELKDLSSNNEGLIENLQNIASDKVDKVHLTETNPHNITPAKIGAYSTSEIDTLLSRKEDLPYLNIYNGEGGNPRAIRFATADYSSCNSNNGIYAKISLMSGHGNGVSYCFLEDVFIKVAYNYVDENSKPTIQVNNFKYYESEVDGNPQKYGDVYWTVDESVRKVYFYVLAGQWSHVYQSPWRRLSWSTGGNIIQDTACVYSDGRPQNWANNTRYAMKNEVPSNKETWTFTLEDGSTVTKEVYVG